MIQVNIERATPQDIAHVVGHLREPDRAEAIALTGLSPERAAQAVIDMTEIVMTGVADGEPICIFGVSSGAILGVGRPWILATDSIERYRFAFLRRNREWV